jgi:hypothetical protein
MVFMSSLLVFGICAFKWYLNIRMFEKVSGFPDLGTVVSKCDPLFALVVNVSGLGFILGF